MRVHEWTGAAAGQLLTRYRNNAHGIIRTTYASPEYRGKVMKIKFMGLVFRLMEQGRIFESHTHYCGEAGENYGTLNWENFWLIYNDINWDLLTEWIVEDYNEYIEYLKQLENYEEEAGNLAYEDFLNSKIWGQ